MTTTHPSQRPALRRFTGLLASERIKLTSLASMRWLGALALLAALVGAALPALTVAGLLVNVAALGGPVIGLIGALASSGEFATGTVGPTLTAEPRRGRAVAAKAVVVAAAGFLLGAVSSLIVLPGMPPGAREVMTIEAYAVSALGLAVFYAAVGAFMTCIGFVVRRVPIAVTIAVAFLFLAPAITGGMVVGDHVYLSDFTLTESGAGLVMAPEVGSQLWRSVLVTLAWPAVAALAATVVVKRRDV